MTSPFAGIRSADDTLTREGVIAGTVAYMSPEQARGEEMDERTDLFSLGVVFYEMATAHQPFAGSIPVVTIDAVLNLRPPAPSNRNPSVPAGLDPIIARMLEKDRALRYPHAADVRASLERLRQSGAAAAPRVGFGMPRIWKVFAALFSAAIAAGIYYRADFHRGAALTDKDTIVLADFTNRTGDPIFDGHFARGCPYKSNSRHFSVSCPGSASSALCG